MPSITSFMSLETWPSQTDFFDHSKLASNFGKLDAHDHTTGKGTQVPSAGIKDGAVTKTKLAPDVLAAATPYRIIDARSGVVTPGMTAQPDGLLLRSDGGTVAVPGTAAASLRQVGFYMDPADIGPNPLVRLRARLTANNVTPTPISTWFVGVAFTPITPQSNSDSEIVVSVPVQAAAFYGSVLPVAGAVTQVPIAPFFNPYPWPYTTAAFCCIAIWAFGATAANSYVTVHTEVSVAASPNP